MRENYKFCQQASEQYERWLEEAYDDPRIVASVHIAAEWRTPYHMAPGQEIMLSNTNDNTKLKNDTQY